MSVAFYSPMKPIDDPRPSGDRSIGRGLFAALDLAERAPRVACRLKSRDARGDPARQARLRAVGERIAHRLIQRFADRPPRAWFTYHVYYKAPDYIGPKVAAALKRPYVIAEASHAPPRLRGDWAIGAAASADAIRAADRILMLNPADAPAISALRGQRGLLDFPPFLDLAPFAGMLADRERMAARRRLSERVGGDPDRPIALAVGMMRPGAKQRSFDALAAAWRRLRKPPRLALAGDGPARPAVERIFYGLDAIFLGEVAADGLPALYAGADLLVWPAVDEALGMTFLEAQASGLPVIAGAEGLGVATMLIDGETGLRAPGADPVAFAAAIARLTENADLRAAMSAAALRFSETRSLRAATGRLDRILSDIGA